MRKILLESLLTTSLTEPPPAADDPELMEFAIQVGKRRARNSAAACLSARSTRILQRL